jgi:hypothetical protein
MTVGEVHGKGFFPFKEFLNSLVSGVAAGQRLPIAAGAAQP